MTCHSKKMFERKVEKESIKVESYKPNIPNFCLLSVLMSLLLFWMFKTLQGRFTVMSSHTLHIEINFIMKNFFLCAFKTFLPCFNSNYYFIRLYKYFFELSPDSIVDILFTQILIYSLFLSWNSFEV